MKTTLLFLCSMLGCAVLNAQTFVSTEPQNKNAILEEFTGLRCVNCPDGHRIANELLKNNPERLFAINIHSYSAAIPDYRTEFGDSITKQFNVGQYPTGIINRHAFPGSGTVLNRDQWESCAGQIMEQSSYVNVAARSALDVVSRQLTVTVELYYTGDAAVDTNYINVALLQNNILGPQVGMERNPDQIAGDQYRHMHMLRHLLTGRWGDKTTDVSEGSFVTRTYVYTIPTHLRNVEYNLEDLEVIVFVAEGRNEIVTGAKSEIRIVNGAPIIKQLSEIETCLCTPEIQLAATVFNFSDTDVTSLQFKYKLDDGAENTLTWNYKTIAPMATDTVHLCMIPVVSGKEHLITASLPAFNNSEEIQGAIPFQLAVKKTIVDVAGEQFTFILTTDRNANETSFKVFDANEVYLEGGPFNQLGYNGITRRVYDFVPPALGCYKLEVYDTGGDGINAGMGAGYIELCDTSKNLIFRNDGKFGSQANYHINVTDKISITGSKLDATLGLYPNPVSNRLHVDVDTDAVTVEVFNLQGQKVLFTDKKEVDVTELSSGVYLIKINTAKEVAVKSFVKR